MTTDLEKHGYLCTNPNCGKSFSRPKIIKYYVCPTCQTLIIMDTEIARSNQEIMNHDSTINENRIPRPKRKQKTKTTNKIASEDSVALQVSHACEKAESVLSSNLPDLEDLTPVRRSEIFDSQLENGINEVDTEKTQEDLSEKSPFVIDSKPEIETAYLKNPRTDDYLSVKNVAFIDSKSEPAIKKSDNTKTPDLEVPISVPSYGNLASEPEDTLTVSEESKVGTDSYLKSTLVNDSQSDTKMLEPERTKTDADLFRDYVELTTNADSKNTSTQESSEVVSADEKSSETEFKCNRHFGYLSERDKGEQIPEHCYGCSKSIECMLESNESSNKKIEGIKQWYISP